MYIKKFSNSSPSVALSDMILTKEGTTTAGSKMLENTAFSGFLCARLWVMMMGKSGEKLRKVLFYN